MLRQFSQPESSQYALQGYVEAPAHVIPMSIIVVVDDDGDGDAARPRTDGRARAHPSATGGTGNPQTQVSLNWDGSRSLTRL